MIARNPYLWRAGVLVALLSPLAALPFAARVAGGPPPVVRLRPMLPPPVSQLRTGDLIFRSGIAAESFVIKAFDRGGAFSHVGLLDVGRDGAHVVHIEPGSTADDSRVRREPLNVFLAPGRADAYAVYHVAPADPVRGAVAVAAALRYVAHGTSFDRDYRLDTPDALYCTELVWRAYREAGLDLIDGRVADLPTLLRRPVIAVAFLAGSRHLVAAASGAATPSLAAR